MAWKTELVRILRHLVDDVTEPYTFGDGRLQETILVAGQVMSLNLDFSQTYEIDVDQLILSPDPTEGDKDKGFVALVCLKAACIIAYGEFRRYSNEAIVASDGLSRLDSTKRAEHYSKLAEARQKDFEQAKIDFQTGNSSKGFIITGPFSHPDFDTASIDYRGYYRGR